MSKVIKMPARMSKECIVFSQGISVPSSFFDGEVE